jgi:SpoVK/Ycf46/Vps4 family AAA+-type ATPase
LVLVVATNFLNRLDAAFRRRCTFNVFVGLPSPQARLNCLRSTRGGAASVRILLPDTLDALAMNLTTNFSGANIAAVRAQIEATLLEQHRERALAWRPGIDPPMDFHVLKHELSQQCAAISQRDGICQGSFYLPDILIQSSSKLLRYLSDGSFQTLIKATTPTLPTSDTTNTSHDRCTGTLFINNLRKPPDDGTTRTAGVPIHNKGR